MHKSFNFAWRLLIGSLVFLSAGCSAYSTATAEEPAAATDTMEGEMLKLTSSAFANNGEMANRYAYKMGNQCNGENYSPALRWEDAPEGTRSFTLTMIDPDGGNWVHWLLVNLPPDLTSLEESIGGPEVGIAGRNSFGKDGYGGPCPPSGTHHYVFTLYALDITLEAKQGVTLKEVKSQMEGHILAQSDWIGLKSAGK